MTDKQSLMLKQLNTVIDRNPQLKELKVNKDFYDFVVWKYKVDMFRGVKLVKK